METLFFSLFLGMVGGLLIGGVTSIVLLISGDLSFGGIGVSLVNSFIIGASIGVVTGILRQLLPPIKVFIGLSRSITEELLPPTVVSMFALFPDKREAAIVSKIAVKVFSLIIAIPMTIVLIVGLIGAPILTSRHNELYIWSWPGIKSLQWRAILKSPTDEIELMKKPE